MTVVEWFFSLKKTGERKGLKILTFKHVFQGLSIALAQVKAGNTYENLLNEICQIIYFYIEQRKLLKQYVTI